MKEQFLALLHQCRTSKYANVYLFLIFAFSLFVQCVLFHWFAFHSVLISALWKNPLRFWAFYLPKISISLIISCFVFVFKRKYWTICVSLLTNVWIIAELIYFRSTRIFIDAYSFFLVGNLHGFWSSVFMYFEWSFLVLFIPTLLLILGVFFFDNRKRNIACMGVAFCLWAIVNIVSANVVNRNVYPNDKQFFYSHIRAYFVQHTCGWNVNIEYIQKTSVLHAFVLDGKQLIEILFQKKCTLSAEENQTMQQLINTPQIKPTPTNPLIIILIESLETWAVRPEITPNLCRFMDTHSNQILRATRITSQTKGENSGDGQMICNTGLLPAAQGAACNRFPTNTYPSLSDLYTGTAMIQPGNLGTWNQAYMNKAYHIDTAFVNPCNFDSLTFNVLDTIYDKYAYTLAITIATHTPFLVDSKAAPAVLPEGMPTSMTNYLNSMHYTDSCWGAFLSKIDTDSMLRNSTICFIGDHIIFNTDQRSQFQDYCTADAPTYHPEEAYTTFIAYSPNIEQHTVVDKVTYQMDIYPTILHLIGCEEYYWKGFGINLLDPVAQQHRPIEENEAYILSDKLLRSNWFATMDGEP